MYNPSGVLNLSHSEVSNSSDGIRTSASTTISSSNIHDTVYGVYADSGTLDLTDTTFSGNYYADVHVEPGVTYTHSGNTYSGGQNEGIFKSGTLTSNETWNADTIYVVTSTVTVATSVTLTIEHGAIVKFGSGKSLIVNGTLDAQGTAEDKIYFTSDKDDSQEAGGDTNGDGQQTSATSGNWDTIQFDENATATLTNAVIRYGGSGGHGSFYVNGGKTNLNDSEVATSTYGIYQASGTSTIADNTIHAHTIGLYALSGTLYLPDNNTFYDNETATSIDPSVNLNPSSGTSGYEKSGTLTANETWDATDLPYIIADSGLTVGTGITLTIEPGVVVKFAATSSKIIVDGALRAMGEEENKIYFTSFKDDQGGDTNGNTDPPAAGNWDTIQFESGASGTIAHAVVRYGGYAPCCVSVGEELINNGGTFSLSDSEVATSSYHGVYQVSGTTTIVSSYVHHGHTGIYLSAGSLTVSSSEISNNVIGFHIAGGASEIAENAVHNNTSYGLLNDTASTIFVPNNWWGADSGPYPQGTGDRVSGDVDPADWHHNDSWFLVNSSLGLVWSSTSTLMSELNAAMVSWNDTASGMGIVTMTSSTPPDTHDVMVYDTTSSLNPITLGRTFGDPLDMIELFTDKITATVAWQDLCCGNGYQYKRWVPLHELGHTLGLGHYFGAGSEYTEVMYTTDRGITTFGDGDKSDYNFLWNIMRWAIRW